MTLNHRLSAMQYAYQSARYWLFENGHKHDIPFDAIRVQMDMYYEGGWRQFLIDQDINQ